ncbi:MAG: YraN family protein [Gammaproteobacteria bacterium]|nr:MAG: YraN family protein [Gammaproteobacteria bacterium]
MQLTTRQRGAEAEQQAEMYLVQRGLRTVARNYRTLRGELDLVMQDGETLVFVEVRYRKNTGFGGAAESVHRAKQQRVIAAAQHYLQRRRLMQSACRFDVMLLGRDKIDWIKDAFQA